MLSNKKKLIIYIGIAILAVIIIATSTIFLLKSQTNTTTKTPVLTAQQVADDNKDQAIKKLNSDPAAAKLLLEKALQQYKDLNDTNSIVDTEAQLSLLEYKANHK